MWNYCVVWEDDKNVSYPYMILPEIVHLVMGNYCWFVRVIRINQMIC